MTSKWMMFAMFLSFALSTNIQAGAKDDFIAAVKKYCGKSDGDAAAMATPGRTGNVMKLKLCKSDSTTIDGCKIPCKDASSKIGN